MIHRRKFRKCTQRNNLPTTSLPQVNNHYQWLRGRKKTEWLFKTLTDLLYGKWAELKRNWLEETSTPTELFASFILFLWQGLCYVAQAGLELSLIWPVTPDSSCLYHPITEITGQECAINKPSILAEISERGEGIKLNKTEEHWRQKE